MKPECMYQTASVARRVSNPVFKVVRVDTGRRDRIASPRAFPDTRSLGIGAVWSASGRQHCSGCRKRWAAGSRTRIKRGTSDFRCACLQKNQACSLPR